MALKVSLVQAAAASGTPTFTQDFTDAATFAGATPELAIFFAGGNVSADTVSDGAQFQLGATDGTRYGAISFACDTASAAANVGRANLSDTAYVNIDNTGTEIGKATASLIANGARLSWSNESAGENIAALLIGGDVEAYVVSWSSPGGTGAKTITHGLTGTPDAIIAFSAGTVDATSGGGTVAPSIGFWSAAGQAGYGHRLPDVVSTSAVSARISTTQAIVSMSGTAPLYSAVIESVGATTFDVNFDVSTTNRWHFVCLRSTSGSPLAVKAGTFATKTTTGTQADISGMSPSPQMVFAVPTALTSADASSTSDTAGNFGLGVAVVNTGSDATQYAGVQHGADDGVATTNDWLNYQRSSATHLRQLTTAGATAVEATVSDWSGGVTHNYGTASGTATQIAYLAIGSETSAASTPKGRMLMTGVG